MEVEQFHNFAIEDGLIVHNCIDSCRYALNRVIGRKVAKTGTRLF